MNFIHCIDPLICNKSFTYLESKFRRTHDLYDIESSPTDIISQHLELEYKIRHIKIKSLYFSTDSY